MSDGLSGVASGQMEISGRDRNLAEPGHQARGRAPGGSSRRCCASAGPLPAARQCGRPSREYRRNGQARRWRGRDDRSAAAAWRPISARDSSGARRSGASSAARASVASSAARSPCFVEGRARLGRAVPITGRLLTRDGRALPGSLVFVFAQGADGAERFAGTATTDAAGRYRYMVRASANQKLKLFYMGAPRCARPSDCRAHRAGPHPDERQ